MNAFVPKWLAAIGICSLLLSCDDAAENTVDACGDGVDNDGDGYTDDCDQDCAKIPEYEDSYYLCHDLCKGDNSEDNDVDDDDETDDDDDETDDDDDETDDDDDRTDDDGSETEDADTGSPDQEIDTSNDPELGPGQDGALNCITAPEIDGVLNEGFWDLRTDVTKETESSDNQAAFDACWDDDYLYVVVSVTDGDICVGSATSPWWYDSVEVYLDPDNSKTVCDSSQEPYHCYDAFDSQLVMKYNDDFDWREYGGSTSEENRPAYNVAGTETADGYVIEVRIPWSDMGIVPEAELIIGFDIGINDDDQPCTSGDGDEERTRDAELRWQGDNENFILTDYFGELILFPRTVK